LTEKTLKMVIAFSNMYEVMRERMRISYPPGRFTPSLAITVQHMGLGDSQYISQPIAVVYMHISLMDS
jgi:hypothetical protein